MNFGAMSSVINYIKQGKMSSLAVTTTERDPQLPNVPTLREVGLTDYDVTNWYGVVAPAAAPREIVTKLNAEINRITLLPDVKAKLDELGTRLNPMTPEKFTEFLQAEIAKYRKVYTHVMNKGARGVKSPLDRAEQWIAEYRALPKMTVPIPTFRSPALTQ